VAPLAGGAVGLAAGTAIGTTAAEAGLGVFGVIAGAFIGPYLEKRDTVYFDKAIDVAAVAEPGKPVHWVNPNTGTSGIMIREADVDITTDETCRRLHSEERLKTEIKIVTMVVCRPELGTWYIRSSWLVGTKPIAESAAKPAPEPLTAPPPDTAPKTTTN
jgi:hypothetical protein